jgi:phosphonate transport system substrate-binding protein
MKGKTIALADPATAGGYLAQKEYLAGQGINIDTDMKIFWAGSHEAAIRAVMSHQAEVGGAKDSIVKKYRKENKVFDTLIEIINETPKKGLPDNTFAVRKGLEPQKIAALKNALLQMHSDPEGKKVLSRFGAVKFIPTSDDDFKPLYDLVRHLKIDLGSYPYKKNSQ